MGCVALMGKREMHTGFLWGNLKERVHLEDPWHSYEDNIKVDYKEIGWKDVVLVHWSHDRDQWQVSVNMMMNSTHLTKHV